MNARPAALGAQLSRRARSSDTVILTKSVFDACRFTRPTPHHRHRSLLDAGLHDGSPHRLFTGFHYSDLS
jgi:hypothetical protein